MPLPIIANGEIWTAEHAALARERSGCEHLMLGRGMVANPALARQLAGGPAPPCRGAATAGGYLDLVRAQVAPKHQAGCIKQWLHYLRRHYAEAQTLYDGVRTLHSADALTAHLQAT